MPAFPGPFATRADGMFRRPCKPSSLRSWEPPRSLDTASVPTPASGELRTGGGHHAEGSQ